MQPVSEGCYSVSREQGGNRTQETSSKKVPRKVYFPHRTLNYSVIKVSVNVTELFLRIVHTVSGLQLEPEKDFRASFILLF